jgi:hypothetical protein
MFLSFASGYQLFSFLTASKRLLRMSPNIPRAYSLLNGINIKEPQYMLPEPDTYSQQGCSDYSINLSPRHDLTTVLIALDTANTIADPIGRYQALWAIAEGFSVNYSTLTHLSALYFGQA